jgi:hypothetical protein
MLGGRRLREIDESLDYFAWEAEDSADAEIGATRLSPIVLFLV